MKAPYIETIIIRGLDGTVVETYNRCSICGADQFWGDECPYVKYTGKHEPQDPNRHRVRRRGKYRKMPSSQIDLWGHNLREVFWGKKKEGGI